MKKQNMTLNELIEQVEDEQSFLVFVKALEQDRRAEENAQREKPIDAFGRGPEGWENHGIVEFLEAATAWAESTNFGLSQGLSESNVWQRIAAYLYCGKIYE